MQFDDALNKAKDFAGEHEEQTNQAIDGASDKAQGAAPDQVDGFIDQGADGVRGQLGLGGDEAGEQQK